MDSWPYTHIDVGVGVDVVKLLHSAMVLHIGGADVLTLRLGAIRHRVGILSAAHSGPYATPPVLSIVVAGCAAVCDAAQLLVSGCASVEQICRAIVQ